MNSRLSDPARVGAACECIPHCVDVATGVLMERHGFSEQEARGSLQGSARRRNTSVHSVSQDVIDAIAQGLL